MPLIRFRTALAITVGWLLLAGCTSTMNTAVTDGSTAADTAGWAIATPPGLVPASLSAGSAGVLVGGASDEIDHRPLLAVRGDESWLNIPATATTAYGGMAEIVHVDLTPDGQVVAIGTVAGGAHLNPRWSAWIGSTQAITEEPQTAETFGGPEAGGITDVLSGPAPLVVGTWTLSAGVLGVTLWQHSAESTGGQTWLRQASPPMLVGSDQELITPAAAAWSTQSPAAEQESATASPGDDTHLVIAGLVTSLRAGAIHQQAVVWLSTDPTDQDWTRLNLVDSDQDSAATDLSCAGGACVVVGRLGDRLAAWGIDTATGSVSQIASLPDIAVDRYLGQPRVGVDGADGAEWVIAPGASGDPLLTSRSGGGWTSMPVPTGEQRDVGLADGTIYLLVRPEQGPQVLYSQPIA